MPILMAWLVVGLGLLFVVRRVLKRSLRKRPACPRCDGSLQRILPMDPLHLYEVLSCSECSAIVTTAQGRGARHTWCPACRQRALELSVNLTASGLEVNERCHLCGHSETRVVPMPDAAPRGIVIDFPGDQSGR